MWKKCTELFVAQISHVDKVQAFEKVHLLNLWSSFRSSCHSLYKGKHLHQLVAFHISLIYLFHMRKPVLSEKHKFCPAHLTDATLVCYFYYYYLNCE